MLRCSATWQQGVQSAQDRREVTLCWWHSGGQGKTLGGIREVQGHFAGGFQEVQGHILLWLSGLQGHTLLMAVKRSKDTQFVAFKGPRTLCWWH